MPHPQPTVRRRRAAAAPHPARAPGDTASTRTGDSTAARRGMTGHTSRHEIFPSGHVFAPLVASLEESQFRNGYLLGSAPNELDTRLAVTRPGANVALMRMHGGRAPSSWRPGTSGRAGAKGGRPG